MPKYIAKQVYDPFCAWPYHTPYGTVPVREIVPTAKKPKPKKEPKKCTFQYPPEIAALLSGKRSSPPKGASTKTGPSSRSKRTLRSTEEPSTTA